MRRVFHRPHEPQLLIYARELGGQYRRVRHLERALHDAEEQLHELGAACVAAQEEERQWIAVEVHDRIAQCLIAASRELRKLEEVSPLDSPTREIGRRAAAALGEAMRHVRRIMEDLYPPAFEKLGLAFAIADELSLFEDETGCRTTFKVNYSVKAPMAVEGAIYRIFHEALSNAGRHAGAVKKLGVRLASSEHVITIEVQDDGVGFDMREALERKRIGGLVAMQRRAEMLFGALQVASGPKGGCTVTARIPLNGSRAKGTGNGK